MTWLLILAGALLGAFLWRWRGSGGNLAAGRALCALLIAVPALWHDWPLGLLVLLLAWRGASTDHDPGGRLIWQNLDSGLFFCGPAAIVAAAVGDWIGAAALLLAGLAKGPVYRYVPRGPEPYLKFLYRELAWGALWGAAAGAAI